MKARGWNTGTAVLLSLGTRWGGWSMPCPCHFTLGKNTPQEAVWALPFPHQDLIPGPSSPYQVTNYNDYALPAPFYIGKRNKHKLVTSENVNYAFILPSLHSAGDLRGFHLDRTNLFVNDTNTATMGLS